MKLKIMAVFCYIMLPILLGNASEIEDLFSKDVTKANIAYDKLFASGFESVPLLIKIIKSDEKFYGDSYVNSISSMTLENITVGIISMYLIDCICKKDKYLYLCPYLVPRRDGGSNNEYIPLRENDEKYLEIINKVSEIYKIWYIDEFSKNKNNIKLPLFGEKYYWYGGFQINTEPASSGENEN